MRGSHFAKKQKPNLNLRRSLFYSICSRMTYLFRNFLKNRNSLDQFKRNLTRVPQRLVASRERSIFKILGDVWLDSTTKHANKQFNFFVNNPSFLKFVGAKCFSSSRARRITRWIPVRFYSYYCASFYSLSLKQAK